MFQKSATRNQKMTSTNNVLFRFISNPKRIAFLLITIFIFTGFALVTVERKVSAATGINQTINFQGKVVNSNGTNVDDGQYTFVFKIYDAASGGANPWTETQNNVQVTAGVFRVSLGSVTPISGVDFNTDNIYLGINFNSDGEMTPRVRFASVPYAMNAKTVAGLTVTDTTGTFTLAAGKTLTVNNTIGFSGTDSTTFTLPGASGTIVTLDASQILTNKTIGSSGLTFSGANTDVTTGENESLTLAVNGTGNVLIQSGSGGQAALIVNKTGSGDIFAASSSGITKFVITSDGNASSSAGFTIDGVGNVQSTLGQTLTVGGGTSGNLVLGQTGKNINFGSSTFSDCTALETSGGILSCGVDAGGGDNFWQYNTATGIVANGNLTTDFLLGGTATQSSKFAVIGIAGTDTPVASVSAVGGTDDTKGIYLKGDGSLQSVRNNTLTLGGDTTGNINFRPGNSSTSLYLSSSGNVGIGTAAPGETLDVVGSLLLGANSTIDTRSAGSLSIGTQANTTSLSLGRSGNTTTFNSTSWTATPTISGLITATSGVSIATGQSYTGAGTVTLSSASNNDLTLTPQGTGNLIITSDSDTGVRIGANAVPATLFVGGGIGGNAGLIVNRVGSTDDIFTASSSGVTKFVIKNDGVASSSAGFTIDGVGIVQSTNNQTLTLGGGSTGDLVIGRVSQNVMLPGFSDCTALETSGGILSCGSDASGGGDNFWQYNSSTGIIAPGNLTVATLFGGTASLSASFRISGSAGSGTNPVASVSANTSYAGFVFDQRGVGDILTASTSGVTQLVLTNSGALGLGLGNGNSPTAKLDVNGTASISSQLSFRNGAGAVQTTGNNSLTIGGDTTGNIYLRPGNSQGIVKLIQADTGTSGFLLTTSEADNTDKIGRLKFGSYLNSEEHFTGIIGSGEVSANQLFIGGGSSTENAATIIRFRTASAVNTTQGTERMRIDNKGWVGIGEIGDANTALQSQLYVTGGSQGANAVAIINQTGISANDILAASASGTTKFVIKNDGTASTSGSFVLDGSGALQTTRNQKLTIGGSSTGDINIVDSLFLGVDELTNGGLTFYSSGAGETDPSIYADASGNLILSAPTGSVQVGNGTGNITLSLETVADVFIADKTVNLSTNYSSADFTFQRVLTGGANNQGGSVFTIKDISGGSGTINGDILLVNSALTSGNFTGYLARFQQNGIDKFRIQGNGTTPVASVAANSSFAGMVVDQNNVGDIFTASKSGATKFTINNAGNIIANNYQTCTLKTDSTGLITCSTDNTGSGSNWTLGSSGTLSSNNNTLDFLWGATSTASAAFKITGQGNPFAGTLSAASVSANTSFAGLVIDNRGVGDLFTASSSGVTQLVLTNNGALGLGLSAGIRPTAKLDVNGNASISSQLVFRSGTGAIQTTGMGTLTFGGDTTGNISIRPGNTTGLTFLSNGRVGIGTTTPLSTLDVRAQNGTISIASVAGATSFAGFIVDNSIGDLFTASSSGITRFTIQQNGTVQIGSLTNGLTFDYLNGGPNFTGSARPTKTLTLSPEYAGSIVTASGSATTNGSMSSDASASASLSRTYYEWVSTQTILQDYVVALRVTLPADFSGWASGNTMTINFNTGDTATTANGLDVYIYNPSDDATGRPVYFSTNNVSSVDKTWTTVNLTSFNLDDGTSPDWDLAGETVIIYLKMKASGTYNYTQVGDIVINYLAKF